MISIAGLDAMRKRENAQPAITAESADSRKLNFPFIPVPTVTLNDSRLTPGDALIVGRIAFAANGSYGICTLANKTIAEETGLSEANVERRLPVIERCGYIKRRIE